MTEQEKLDRAKKRMKICGITVTVLFILVMLVIPLFSVIVNSLKEGVDFYMKSVTTEYVKSALGVTFIATLIAVIVNTFFGICAAWLLTKFSFKGKQILATLIDIPFSISPVIVGLAYLMTFGRLGWFYPAIRAINQFLGTNIRITMGKRYPNQLSGGQRQRVAFARALAPNPQVLLLDEPFAAIDAKVRTELRTWLREMVEKLGITSIFVTHDQDEAVEVADEIIITNHGTIEQMGSPVEIYKSPATPFVAKFIGRSSVVEEYDKLKGFLKIADAKKAVIRPEFVKISKSGKLDQYISAAETGVVTDVVFRGNRMDVTVNINGIHVVGERSLEKDFVSVGEKVHVLIYRLYVFDASQTYLLENMEMQERSDVFYI